LTDCQKLAEQALQTTTSGDIMRLCADFARSRYGELVA
jgi:hypothetical protein